MRCITISVILLSLVLTLPCFAQAGPMAWWSFDEKEGRSVKDNATEVIDRIHGNYWYAEGVKGSCLKLDGYTTHVVRSAEKAPRLRENFTVEAWVAPQTYPWNWTGIIDMEKDHKDGIFFGVSADGNVGLGVATVSDGQWLMCISKNRIEPLKWSHIAATYEGSGELAVYINGKKSGEFSGRKYGWEWMGHIRRPEGVDMWIGRSHTKMYPKGTERPPSRRELSNMIFDGLIDEVKIYREALSDEEVMEAYQEVQPKNPQPLKWRRFPTEGADKHEFGAYYTRLTYDETWDKLWRIGEHSDILVTFAEPVRIVFWHGINYAATFVTENEIWMGDQSLECGSPWGCNEHMSDKQCRYAHVRLIENNPARVVVHWRYALCDILYQIPNTDKVTGWGDWTDEYFVIYPDVVAVRHQVLHSSNFGVALDTSNEQWGKTWHQFQETIMFNQPGTWPQDNVDKVEALTVANMDGETYTCKWGEDMEYEEEEIVKQDVVKNATIQMTNLKSKFKHFIIFEPGSVIAPWVGEGHSFWNHWPVAQLPSDGREAPSNDRPSHTSFSCGAPVIHEGDGDSHIAVMLYGLTESPIEELVPLARSWNHPPKLKVIKGNLKHKGYDKFQRAYILEYEDGACKAQMQMAGSKETPIVNPAFVFKGWGRKEVSVKVSGEEFEEGKNYKAGYEKKIDGVDLVLWFKGESKDVETLSIEPKN